VAQTSPVNAYITDDTSQTLSWNAVNFGNTYQIQVDQSSYFKTATTYTSDVGATSYTLGSMDAGKWYWHVRACNVNNGCGSWSSTRYFTIYAKFDSEFATDGDNENWEDNSGASWSASSGHLTTAGLNGGSTSSASYGGTNFTDFTYEVSMKMDAPASDEANSFGIVLRGTPAYDAWNDWTNGIYFVVRQVNDSATGSQYACALAYKIASGRWTYLGGACGGALYGDWNDLTVYAKGSTIKFYLNDYLVASKSVSGFSTGGWEWSPGARTRTAPI
jgi:hypothetical protein